MSALLPKHDWLQGSSCGSMPIKFSKKVCFGNSALQSKEIVLCTTTISYNLSLINLFFLSIRDTGQLG